MIRKCKMQNAKCKIKDDRFTNQRLATNDQRLHLGFTMLELIIVMALIAILSAAIWGNFFTALTKSRDSKRKQDLEAMSKALELYYNDNRTYPSAFPGPATPFAHPTIQTIIYMQKVPADPMPSTYFYCYPTVPAGGYYKLYANIENTNDPKVIPTVSCGGVNYNYGLSSQNTSP